MFIQQLESKNQQTLIRTEKILLHSLIFFKYWSFPPLSQKLHIVINLSDGKLFFQTNRLGKKGMSVWKIFLRVFVCDIRWLKFEKIKFFGVKWGTKNWENSIVQTLFAFPRTIIKKILKAITFRCHSIVDVDVFLTIEYRRPKQPGKNLNFNISAHFYQLRHLHQRGTNNYVSDKCQRSRSMDQMRLTQWYQQ